MAQHKARRAVGRGGEQTRPAAEAPTVSPEGLKTVEAMAKALAPAEVTRAPGALRQRLPRMQRAAQTALAKTDELVAVPMAPDAPLTREELRRTADLVAALALANADVVAASAEPVDPATQREEAGARAAQVAVLRGIRHVFRADRKVRQWVLKVSRGEGLADLMSDADEMQAFWTRHATELSALTRGEAEQMKRMVVLASGLRPRAQAANAATAVRRLRDAIYTLAARGIARIRAAAAYAFDPGDPLLAAFRTTPPRRKKKAVVREG